MSAPSMGGASMDKRTALPIYVLVTPSRNEAAFIEKTLESVVRQTVLPAKWVIVNDGSTDETGTVAAKYAEKYPWIEVVNLPVRQREEFCCKGKCVQRRARKSEGSRLRTHRQSRFRCFFGRRPFRISPA